MTVRVRVENFQSIRDAEIEISGLTVVTGANNTGKTALQRAIRGVFQNTSGTSFIREGAATCKVTVDFGDRKVAWSKGTGSRDRPTYVIDDAPPIFPGQTVPDEVAAFGVIPIQAGGVEVWPTVAPQFSGQVFLLDRPGSSVAEAVADVERVGQLNRALRKAEGDRRTASATLKVRQSDLIAFESEAKKYQGLDEAVSAVTALEESAVAAQKLWRAVQTLAAILGRLTIARASVAVLAPVGAITLPTTQAPALRLELEGLRKLQQRLKQARQDAARYSGIDAVMVAVDEKPARRLYDGLKVLRDFRVRLSAATQRVEATKNELTPALAEETASVAAFAQALKELGKCPTCLVEVPQ